MTFRMEKKLPYNADVDRFYVWLIWGLKENGIQELVAIATTETAVRRYRKMAKVKGYIQSRVEQTWLDHAYAESLMQ